MQHPLLYICTIEIYSNSGCYNKTIYVDLPDICPFSDIIISGFILQLMLAYVSITQATLLSGLGFNFTLLL